MLTGVQNKDVKVAAVKSNILAPGTDYIPWNNLVQIITVFLLLSNVNSE